MWPCRDCALNIPSVVIVRLSSLLFRVREQCWSMPFHSLRYNTEFEEIAVNPEATSGRRYVWATWKKTLYKMIYVIAVVDY